MAPPGGEIRVVSVVFIDVRGFTALAEQLPPDEVAHRLNRFYSLAATTIFKYDGTLDKLVGDQVMAFFGAPLYAPDHAKRAVQTAFAILEGVNTFTDRDQLHVGAGIATGVAFVGNVGGGAVADYTALGDTVNIAARLQAAAASGEILLTEETYSYVEAEFPGAPRRDMELKGKTEPVHARLIAVDKPGPQRSQVVRP
ncbi:MAG TPA: adenylate/guanylate cyclase domain-containing protein [Candidatus Binatia bacterium]|nr:adenylate/guanylate cyclase domain-containing protein [Candidatus Binatia bacterium]